MKNYTFLSALSILLTLVACNAKQTKSDAPLITVTMEPQRYFTEAIAGDKFDVVSMVPKGSNPETYDPTPSQLVALNDSKAYLRIGHIGFEQTWMDRLLDNTPQLEVFDTSKNIELIYDNSHNHSHSAGNGHKHEGLGVEPHIWSSTKNALIIAQNTYQALSAIDADNKSYYSARYDSLCQQIQQTDSIIRTLLAKPGSNQSFMIYHPALSYFARDYGLHQICIEEGGKEPSPAHLKRLIDLCNNENVKVIFVQPEFDQRNAEIIAEQTGTRVVSINPMSYNWSEELINVAQALTP